MIAELLKERNLPEFRSREEMIDLLLKNEYGYFPNIPYEVSVSEPVNRLVQIKNMGLISKDKSAFFPVPD